MTGDGCLIYHGFPALSSRNFNFFQTFFEVHQPRSAPAARDRLLIYTLKSGLSSQLLNFFKVFRSAAVNSGKVLSFSGANGSLIDTRLGEIASPVFKNFTFFSEKDPPGGGLPRQPSRPPQSYEYYEYYEYCTGILNLWPIQAGCVSQLYARGPDVGQAVVHSASGVCSAPGAVLDCASPAAANLR